MRWQHVQERQLQGAAAVGEMSSMSDAFTIKAGLAKMLKVRSFSLC